MARKKGKGQQFDRLWDKANTIIEESFTSIDNKTLDKICELKSEVEKRTPTSDYEVKDKANLLDQLNRAYIKVLENQHDEWQQRNIITFVGVR